MPASFNKALTTALKNRAIKTAIQLIKKNRQSERLNLTDADGFTPLQYAAAHGLLEVVLWLSYAGASINAKQNLDDLQARTLNNNQKPALYLALENGHRLIAQVLLCIGANLKYSLCLASKTPQEQLLKQLTIEQRVVTGLIQWARANYHPPFQRHLLNLLEKCPEVNKATTLSHTSLTTTTLRQTLLHLDYLSDTTPSPSLKISATSPLFATASLHPLIDMPWDLLELTLQFCDIKSLSRLLSTTRTTQQFKQQLPISPYLLISDFMSELHTIVKKKSIFSHRNWQAFYVLSCVLWPLVIVFSLIPTLLHDIEAIQGLNSLMHNTSVTQNSTEYCDDFIIDTNFPMGCQENIDLGNCTDVCQQLNTQGSTLLQILILGEIIPTMAVVTFLVAAIRKNLPQLLRQFFSSEQSGERRFENLSLDVLQPGLQEKVSQLIRLLKADHGVIPYLSTDEPRTTNDIRRNFSRIFRGNCPGFFKKINVFPPVANDVNISIADEPGLATTPLIALGLSRG